METAEVTQKLFCMSLYRSATFAAPCRGLVSKFFDFFAEYSFQQNFNSHHSIICPVLYLFYKL